MAPTVKKKRPSIFRKKKDKKEDKKQQQQPQAKSTKSFRVKANLDATSHNNNRQQQRQPSPSTTSTTAVPDAITEHRSQQQYGKDALATTPPSSSNSSTTTPTNATPDRYRYIRGGGYCSHKTRSYQDRWSDDHVKLVVDSWEMTPSQHDKLLDLQTRLKDVDHYMNCPHQLVYFLKDEVGKVDEAEKYFRLHVQRRIDSPYSMNDILESYELPDDYDYFPMAILKGTAKDGTAIHITRTGAADCWGLYRRHGREPMIHHAIYNQELDARGAWVEDFEATHGRKVTQFTEIFDLQGLCGRHMRPGLLPVCGAVARILQDNYPEIVKRVIIIRSPYLFKTIWGLVKHFFDPELRDLMIFATSDANSQQVLDQYIDRDVLPHCIHSGGADGPVARGYEHVQMEGGLIPPEGEYKTPIPTQPIVDSPAPVESPSGNNGSLPDLGDSKARNSARTSRANRNTNSTRDSRTAIGLRIAPTKSAKLMSGGFQFVPATSTTTPGSFTTLVNID